MRLAIDIDGVLADFNSGFAKLLNLPCVPPIDDTFPTCWQWPRAVGVTQEQEDASWAQATASNRFWMDLTAYPTAKADLQALGQAVVQGHDVYFLTSRPGLVSKLQSEVWLRIHGYTFAPTVLIALGGVAKGQLCHALDIDVIIDDYPENLGAVANNAMARLFLFDRPWNRAQLDLYPRVTSIIEMLDQLGIRSAVEVE